MTRILEKSSNVGMVYIGEKLGDNKIYDYLQRFGFGQNTNLDIEGGVRIFKTTNELVQN